MASNQYVVLGEEEVEEMLQPLSPSSQCINTSVLSLSIIVVVESETPIDVSKMIEALRNELLCVNKRFSSIIVTDNKGVQCWKRVSVRVEDHVIVPTFPSSLSPKSYTEHLKEYLSKISLEQLPENQPLWEFHIFKYPTCDAEGTIAFKIHHALGDGFSLMGALFSCLKRADNPSLPLTFPPTTTASVYNGEMKICKRLGSFVSGCWNSACDFAWSVLRSTLVEDDRTVVRSGRPGVELMPMEIGSVTFSLDDIRQVKSMVGGSVNDVVVGIVFYGTHLYTEAMNQVTTTSRRTALVLLNTRMVNGYRNLEDMLEKDMWGNHFSFIHLPIPSFGGEEKVDPLKFIFNAKKIIKRKRNSMGIYLNSRLLRMVGSLKGREGVSQYVHSTLKNATMAISNIVGPVEKMVIAGHPINNIYFTVSGSPQSLIFTIMSYMGKLILVVTAEKGFIDSKLLLSCMKKAFEKIFEVACKEDGRKDE